MVFRIEKDHLTCTLISCCVQLRFGMVNKHMSNTNVFEHSGKVYVIAENYVPQELDLHTLELLADWDFNGTWNQPSTSHPKVNSRPDDLLT